MYSRIITYEKQSSFFLFGPRGTGKSTWIAQKFPSAKVFDLLHDQTFAELLASPSRLEPLAAPYSKDWIVIDEVQKLPSLLDEVHRLIEKKKWRFILTGSSARKLRRTGANLLGGRARVLQMHPLTAFELGADYALQKSLDVGQLPMAYGSSDPHDFLKSYIGTYLREEVLQEAIVRNLDAFARFLQAASFSQGSVLNVSRVAEDCGVHRNTAGSFFDLLDDLLLAVRIPVFQRKAKRKMTQHPKFFFFDAGVYRALRPKGPLDSAAEIDGAAIETLVLQELRAHNSYHNLGYEIFFWLTGTNKEVDFVLYGERGLIAIEVKRTSRFHESDLASLRLFREDYPMAKCFYFYGGDKQYKFDDVNVIPLTDALPKIGTLLSGANAET